MIELAILVLVNMKALITYRHQCTIIYKTFHMQAAASAITLGSGASLGPEAPSVELGANTVSPMQDLP